MTTTVTSPGPPLTEEPASAGQVAGRRWRRSRGIVLFILALAVLGLVLGALRPRVQAQYLDPETANRDGARALVQIVGQHGTQVTVARSATEAADRMRAVPDAVLVVVRLERLTETQLDTLRSAPGTCCSWSRPGRRSPSSYPASSRPARPRPTSYNRSAR